MDTVKKFLRKLSTSKQDEINEILSKIERRKTKGLDIKKLKGYRSVFRVRVSNIRIVFSQDKERTHILFVGNRGDSEYEKY